MIGGNMSIKAINFNTGASVVNFCAKEKGAKAEKPPKEKGVGGRGKGWCSVVIPGLGQFVDGRGKAGGMFLGFSALSTGALAISYKSMKKEVTRPTSIVAGIALLSSGILWIASVIDAAAGAKKHKNKGDVQETTTLNVVAK